MDTEVSKVEVADINMPFLSMVWFMVKWAIASINLMVIVCNVWWFDYRINSYLTTAPINIT